MRKGSGYLKPGYEATVHPKLVDIGWAAGIFEGEGSVGTSGPRKGQALTISQKDPWVLHRIKELFGGSVTGKAYGGTYRWGAYGARARGIAMTFYSFLSPRRKMQLIRYGLIVNHA